MSALPDGFEIVAETGDRFANFAPFVPAIARDAIAFQAELATGGTGIFVWQSGSLIELARDLGADFVSHPDLNEGGDVCAYAYNRWNEVTRLVAVSTELIEPIAPPEIEAGPLGPTMNERGDIAFRGSIDGRPGVFAHIAGVTHPVSTTAEEYLGLPIMEEAGSVVFRATSQDGREGIYRWRAGDVVPLAETGGEWSRLAPFPSAWGGAVAFAGTRNGREGAFVIDPEVREIWAPELASIRGVVLAGATPIVLGTPPNGGLGAYLQETRLFGIGDSFAGRRIEEFALNSASVDLGGVLAARLKFEDGRQAIVHYNGR